MVFQPFKQIGLVFSTHLINLFGSQRRGKFLIVREASAFPFGKQGINEFLDVVFSRTVITQDLLVEHQEDLVERICGNLAYISAEQVVFRRQKNRQYVLRRELAILIQAETLHQEGPGNANIQAGHAIEAVIQALFSQAALAGAQLFKKPGITKQVIQKGRDWLANPVRISLKRMVYRVEGGRDLLLDAQIVPNKAAYVIARAFLNLCPVGIVIRILFSWIKPHQDIVANLVALFQRQPRRVQAFKDELRIVVMIERNADDFQFSNSGIQFIDRYVFLEQHIAEKAVIMRKV